MLNNIEAERVRNRLTKEELAKKLGVSMRTYCNWIKEDKYDKSFANYKRRKRQSLQKDMQIGIQKHV